MSNYLIKNYPDNLYLTYQWCHGGECYDGASGNQSLAIELDDSYEAEVTFIVSDLYGETGEASITLNGVEPNEAPVADLAELTEDQSTLIHDGALGGSLSVTLSAEGTSDGDSDALSYTWTSGDFEAVTDAPTLEFTREIDQAYSSFSVSITVSDPYGAESSDEITVQATEPNEAPVADAGGREGDPRLRLQRPERRGAGRVGAQGRQRGDHQHTVPSTD